MNILKKLGVITLLGVISIGVSGCGPDISIGMNEDKSGSYECKFCLDKNYISESGNINASNVDEVVEVLDSKFDKSLNLKIEVDKTSQKDKDIIVVSYDYSNPEDLNDHVERTIKG